MSQVTRLVVLVAMAFLLGACRHGASLRQADPVPVLPLFGPVVGHEVIGGRADDREDLVWLLAGGGDVVRVELKNRVANRVRIPNAAGGCWGLARLREGSLWTLKGRSALLQIAQDGSIVRVIALAESHFGLYANGDRLVYQPARFVQSGPLLFSGLPGEAHPAAWSTIAAREFPTLARASAAALNMIACGSSRTDERPCWFPDDTAVSLVREDGSTRRLPLDGLTRVAPEVLLTSDNPARPLRDVSVAEDGSLWVLSSGTAPTGRDEETGGWLLARYTSAGRLVRIFRLEDPVRLLLRAEPSRLTVLTGAGLVAQVMP
jgi:sugar lactone lactonase YvrE